MQHEQASYKSFQASIQASIQASLMKHSSKNRQARKRAQFQEHTSMKLSRQDRNRSAFRMIIGWQEGYHMSRALGHESVDGDITHQFVIFLDIHPLSLHLKSCFFERHENSRPSLLICLASHIFFANCTVYQSVRYSTGRLPKVYQAHDRIRTMQHCWHCCISDLLITNKIRDISLLICKSQW